MRIRDLPLRMYHISGIDPDGPGIAPDDLRAPRYIDTYVVSTSKRAIAAPHDLYCEECTPDVEKLYEALNEIKYLEISPLVKEYIILVIMNNINKLEV